MSPIAMTEKIINERRPSESTTDTEKCEVKQSEGGRAAWCTVAGSALVYYASFGIMNSFGFFQDYYTRDFLKDTPATTIAFCGTLQMFLMNSLAAVSGALCDRYGVKVFTVFGTIWIKTNMSPSISTLAQDSAPSLLLCCYPSYRLGNSGRSSSPRDFYWDLPSPLVSNQH
jgi:MFS family permease